MSTIKRTLQNLWKVGPRSYAHQMQYIGDTKPQTALTFVARDKYGNTFYESVEDELPLRTRWVDYHDKEYDPSQIEPGWHAWMSYMTHDPPNKDPIAQTMQRGWETPYHRPNMTATRSAYRPYSTVKNKISPWLPKVEERTG